MTLPTQNAILLAEALEFSPSRPSSFVAVLPSNRFSGEFAEQTRRSMSVDSARSTRQEHQHSAIISPTAAASAEEGDEDLKTPVAAPVRYLMPRFLVLVFTLVLVEAVDTPGYVPLSKQLACRSFWHQRHHSIDSSQMTCRNVPDIEHLTAKYTTIRWVFGAFIATFGTTFWTLHLSRFGRRRLMLWSLVLTIVLSLNTAWTVWRSLWVNSSHDVILTSSSMSEWWDPSDLGNNLFLWILFSSSLVLGILPNANLCLIILQTAILSGGKSTSASTASEQRTKNLNWVRGASIAGAFLGAGIVNFLPSVQRTSDRSLGQIMATVLPTHGQWKWQWQLDSDMDLLTPHASLLAALLGLLAWAFSLFFIPEEALGQSDPGSKQEEEVESDSIDTSSQTARQVGAEATQSPSRTTSRQQSPSNSFLARFKEVAFHQPASTSLHDDEGLPKTASDLLRYPLAKLMLVEILFQQARSSPLSYLILLADNAFGWGQKENARYNVMISSMSLFSLLVVTPWCIKGAKWIAKRRRERRSRRGHGDVALRRGETEPLLPRHDEEDVSQALAAESNDLSPSINFEPLLAQFDLGILALGLLLMTLGARIFSIPLLFISVFMTVGANGGGPMAISAYSVRVLETEPVESEAASDLEEPDQVPGVNDVNAAEEQREGLTGSVRRRSLVTFAEELSTIEPRSTSPRAVPAQSSSHLLEAYMSLSIVAAGSTDVVFMAIEGLIYTTSLKWDMPWVIFGWSAGLAFAGMMVLSRL